MKGLFARLTEHARRRPRAGAVSDGQGALTYDGLLAEVKAAAARLSGERVGLLLENGCPWAVLDLAVAWRGAICVPMPSFFSDAQLAHLIRDAGLDTVITDQPERLIAVPGARPLQTLPVAGRLLAALGIEQAAGRAVLPPGTAKLTYTSGTTGAPKGACLSAAAVEGVTAALCAAVGAGPADRALSLLPLSTLLENIGGLYAPLWVGGHAQLPPLAECGLAGSSGLDPRRLFAALQACAPTTVILVPQLLKALVECAETGLSVPAALRFAAVGGAPVSAALVERARRVGIPAFEGYGLSEAGSVVALNRPGADRPGTAGRPLPHLRVAIEDGEIVVAGTLFLGYLGADAVAGAVAGARWRTGDLGHLDADGYLHVTGRRKSAFATAFGRNVSPEWVESELTAGPAIAQAVLCGEGRPFNVAVVVPRPGASAEALEHVLQGVNRGLPDYARVAALVIAEGPFIAATGLASATGAVRREAVAARYAKHIDALYQQGACMPFHEQLVAATEAARAELLAIPLVRRALVGEVSRAQYLAFLGQAYHHVRHTVPLLMACGGRLPAHAAWLREAVAQYIEEEVGHERWILEDIAAAGGDAERARESAPLPATELMVAYAYHVIDRVNPVGFFGMVFVLEGTSVALASRAAAAMGPRLGLPVEAFHYLRSHGAVDQQHIRFLQGLLERLDRPADRHAVTHCAQMFYRLYGDIFRAISSP